ncbi:MAG: hypothetical protein EOP10_13100 [Proteobacteria bacterium]|nr:MAG: hypothetical protein EOP10_13100 [Pseudomonadota bacterium]
MNESIQDSCLPFSRLEIALPRPKLEAKHIILFLSMTAGSFVASAIHNTFDDDLFESHETIESLDAGPDAAKYL